MITPDDPGLLSAIKEHEGFRAHPYTCPAGFLSVGYGYNLDAGMSEAEAEALLKLKLDDAIAHWQKYRWFPALSDNRQRALVEMCYQLGPAGCRKFPAMLGALSVSDFGSAADEMLDSLWASQTPTRADYCARLMHEG